MRNIYHFEIKELDGFFEMKIQAKSLEDAVKHLLKEFGVLTQWTLITIKSGVSK